MSNEGLHPDHENFPTVVVSKSSPLNANGVDATSESGDAERPVREKLKKTSIAQMANGATPPRDVEIGDEDAAEQPPILGTDHKEDTPMENGVDAPEKQSRPLSKRPLIETEDSGTLSPNVMDSSVNGHARKKSRDERTTEAPKEGWENNVSSPESTTESMEEDTKDEILQANVQLVADTPQDTEKAEVKRMTVTPPSTESADQEMKEVLSPRKKRSRDQFEAESQERDQKVAATEQSRLRRRSVELKQSSDDIEAEEVSSDNTSSKLEKSGEGESTLVETGPPTSKSQSKVTQVTRDPLAVSSIPAAGPSTSPPKEIQASRTFGQSTQTSSNAFASSGFATLASSSTSPFGTLASSKPSSDPLTQPSSDSRNPPTNGTSTNHPSDSKQRVFGSATPIASHGKENEKSSVSGSSLGSFAAVPPSGGFGSLGSSGFGSFTAIKGSVFSSPFATGPTKLSSFAAPSGDAKLGPATTSGVKPFGAPAEEGDESDEGSEAGSDDEEKRGEEKREKKERVGEAVDPRFHKQETRDGEDAEDTIFQSPRAKLYAFADSGWKERGTGIFKLNVLHPAPDAAEDKRRPTARFIMRAQLTHRLVLNMPLFKDMDFKEPQGGKLTFSASQDGSLVGHVLRIKEEEARTLYRELKRIQTKL